MSHNAHFENVTNMGSADAEAVGNDIRTLSNSWKLFTRQLFDDVDRGYDIKRETRQSVRVIHRQAA